MGKAETSIVGDYGEAGLGERILARLRECGVDTDRLTQKLLAEFDHIHGGGYRATIEHAKLVRLEQGMAVLDIGCGIGGPARYLAKTFNCRVTGIDLTQDFVDAAAMLSEKCGLGGKVTFQCANALEMPFDDASFDAAFCLNVTMNIKDKAALYAEFARVLKPGGELALTELGKGEAGDPHYPLPWARDATYSFLVTQVDLRKGLEEAGFEIIHWADSVERRREPQAGKLEAKTVLPPDVATTIVRGEDYGERRANADRSAREGRLTFVRLVAKRTG